MVNGEPIALQRIYRLPLTVHRYEIIYFFCWLF